MYRKSFILVLLFFIIPAALFSQISMPELGNVDYEDGVTIIDALITAQYYTGLTPSTFFTTAADVNCDSNIDIIDALLIAQKYVGSVNTFDGCTGEDIVSGYGEIVFLDVEGGCTAIKTEDASYEPLGFPPGMDIGRHIFFRARIRPDMVSICMVGILIEIIQADPFEQ